MNNGYPTQRLPSRWSTPKSGRNFQGDPNEYRQRVPPGTYGGGASRPPDIGRTSLPAPEPRIPQWNGRLRRKPKGTDWWGVATDVLDGMKGPLTNPYVRKFRSGNLILDTIRDMILDNLLDPDTGLDADIGAIRQDSVRMKIGDWVIQRYCMADPPTRMMGANGPVDPGCLINQSGHGPLDLGRAPQTWRSLWLGRENSLGRMDVTSIWTRPSDMRPNVRPPFVRGGAVILSPMDPFLEPLNEIAPGLYPPPPWKSGKVSKPLNRPRYDDYLSTWPQSRSSGYGSTAPIWDPTQGGPTIEINDKGTSIRPPVGLPSPPGPKKKERKATFYGMDGTSFAGRIIGASGELGDFVESFYSTLPDWTKVGDRTLQDKMQTLYEHADKIDLTKAAENIVWNEIEDRFFGKLGKLTGKANRRKKFGGAGLQVGPGLEGGPNPLFQ